MLRVPPPPPQVPPVATEVCVQPDCFPVRGGAHVDPNPQHDVLLGAGDAGIRLQLSQPGTDQERARVLQPQPGPCQPSSHQDPACSRLVTSKYCSKYPHVCHYF